MFGLYREGSSGGYETGGHTCEAPWLREQRGVCGGRYSPCHQLSLLDPTGGINECARANLNYEGLDLNYSLIPPGPPTTSSEFKTFITHYFFIVSYDVVFLTLVSE
jgi:hypothetical protein